MVGPDTLSLNDKPQGATVGWFVAFQRPRARFFIRGNFYFAICHILPVLGRKSILIRLFISATLEELLPGLERLKLKEATA
jgi:hypothetical protein